MNCLCAYASTSDTLQITLEEAKKIAETKQPDFQKYLLDQKIVQARYLQGVTAFVPKVTANAQMQYNPLVPAAVSTISFNRPFATTSSFNATLNIFDPSRIGDIFVAKEQLNYTDNNIKNQLILLRTNVTKLYFNILLEKEKVKQAKINIEKTEGFFRNLEERYNVRATTETELNKAKINYINAVVALRNSEYSENNAHISLANYLGVDLATKFTLKTNLFADFISLSSESAVDVIAMNSDKMFVNNPTSDILQTRPEFKLLQANIQIKKMQIQKTVLQYFPTISVYGNVGASSYAGDLSQIFPSFSLLGNMGVQFSMPIFDGAEKIFIANAQEGELRQNELIYETEKRKLDADLVSSQERVRIAWSNLNALKQNYELAQKIYDNVRESAAQGGASNQDVLDAQYTLSLAQVSYYQSLYDFVVAKQDWMQINGIFANEISKE